MVPTCPAPRPRPFTTRLSLRDDDRCARSMCVRCDRPCAPNKWAGASSQALSSHPRSARKTRVGGRRWRMVTREYPVRLEAIAFYPSARRAAAAAEHAELGAVRVAQLDGTVPEHAAVSLGGIS